jgi:hypothetical protein
MGTWTPFEEWEVVVRMEGQGGLGVLEASRQHNHHLAPTPLLTSLTTPLLFCHSPVGGMHN